MSVPIAKITRRSSGGLAARYKMGLQLLVAGLVYAVMTTWHTGRRLVVRWLATAEVPLSRFFEEVQCHGHLGAGTFADRARHLAEVGLPPERVTIRETDFDFPAVSPEALNADLETVTAIFVCRRPRMTAGPETLAERVPAQTQRIYRLVDAAQLGPEQATRWAAAEEAIYARSDDPLTNWDAPDLLAAG